MDYTLLFQKMKVDSPVKDSFEDFGIVCTDVPFMPKGEAKELANNDWPDESGEDAYIPDTIPTQAFDWEIGMAYKGALTTCHTKIKSFLDYLTGRDGSGGAMKVYSSYTGIGRQYVHYKSVSDFEFVKSNMDEVLTFTLTLRVTDPDTEVVLIDE